MQRNPVTSGLNKLGKPTKRNILIYSQYFLQIFSLSTDFEDEVMCCLHAEWNGHFLACYAIMCGLV
jgi:hypothetical protein